MTFASRAIKYFNNLVPSVQASGAASIINPYSTRDVKSCVSLFYKKFYRDNNKRVFVLGINPGRFGGGLTGISFTDPVELKEHCGIDNSLGNQKELSSRFIYSVVNEYGGTKKFFSKVFLSALYPFALVKDGKNYNYYDDKRTSGLLRKSIVENLRSQINFGANRDYVILLGKKNAEYFNSLNDEFNFFKKIFVLEHPRYIMQYRLKHMHNYIRKYIETIEQ
ncbi:MAG: DUF4918 family protein [Ignavibacteriales bacterium]|nr:MAG: DUF4918 family protein [Ignavibacteriales bacterium]